MDKKGSIIYLYIYTLPQKESSALGYCKITIPNNLFKYLVQIFELNDKNELPYLQKADTNFSIRLKKIGSQLKEHIKEFRKSIKILETIPLDQYFYVIGSNKPIDFTLNDQVEIIQNLFSLNEKKFPFILDSALPIEYNIKGWGQDSNHYIGEVDKSKRVCRFCGKSIPDISFSKKAHAISESLGNRTIICNEECDSCNEKFSIIEQELFNHIGLFYFINGIKGKKGIRTDFGKSLKRDKNSGAFVIKTNRSAPSIEEVENEGFKFDIIEDNLTFTPQNIYKCLCKFALSVIDSKYLSKLSKTIKWVISDDYITDLPPIWICDSNTNTSPLIAIYTRNYDEKTSLLEFVIRLNLHSIEFIYTFPYVREDKIVVSDNIINSLNDLFLVDKNIPNKKYTKCDYSSTKKQTTEIPFKINPLNSSLPQP